VSTATSSDGEQSAVTNVAIRKPKRKFNNYSDFLEFKKEYTKKYKTEMCKNFVMQGSCPFRAKCSFAHGSEELKKRQQLPENWRTRPCMEFHKTGYCPYGSRCQFVHSEHDIFNPTIPYSAVLRQNVELTERRAAKMQEGGQSRRDFMGIYLNVSQKERLPIFKSFCPSSLSE